MTAKQKFTIPEEIQKEMFAWLLDSINEFPEYNVVETVSEWAERKRKIGKGLTANPGPVEFSLTPPLREIADCLSDMSPIMELYVMKATQVGFTVMVLENFIGYCIDYGMGPGLFISGDQDMAEESFEKRVDEMIDSADLSDKIRPNIQKARGKSTGDRMDSKSYGGTFFRAVGPHSESKLRSFPVRFLLLDEIDVYPQRLVKSGSDIGDPLKKAERRTDTYGNLKKILGGSTPKNEGSSRIAAKTEEGDKRYYNILCPGCGFQHPLLWSNFKWEKTEDGKPDIQWEIVNGKESLKKDPTYFECPECEYKIRENEKYDIMLEKGYGGTGEWIPSKKPSRPFVRSYIYPAWYGFRPWREICLEWQQVHDDPFLLPDFVNDVMAETWKESDQKPDQHMLLQISQEFEQWPRGFINKNILLLTLAADIQQDRIEAGLMGWGRNKQGYMIDYWTFEGDPNQVEDKCWKELSDKILTKYKREDGQEMYVMLAFIDSQYLGSTVDLFCDGFPYNENSIAGVFPVLARETMDKLVKNFKSNIKTPTVGINDQEIKRGLYNILRKRPQGPGTFPGYYLHFSHEYSNEFYEQMTSEEIVPVKVRGVTKGYKILNTRQKRNEVLDVTKYNMAALQYAMDRYFLILNQDLKSQKRPEVQEDSGAFFDAIEGMLFGD